MVQAMVGSKGSADTSRDLAYALSLTHISPTLRISRQTRTLTLRTLSTIKMTLTTLS